MWFFIIPAYFLIYCVSFILLIIELTKKWKLKTNMNKCLFNFGTFCTLLQLIWWAAFFTDSVPDWVDIIIDFISHLNPVFLF